MHAACSYTSFNNLPPDHVLLKLGFSNAFNCVCRDKLLILDMKLAPECLPFVHSTYSTSPNLCCGETPLQWFEEVQQGDPLVLLSVCFGIHASAKRKAHFWARGFLAIWMMAHLVVRLERSFRSFTLWNALWRIWDSSWRRESLRLLDVTQLFSNLCWLQPQSWQLGASYPSGAVTQQTEHAKRVKCAHLDASPYKVISQYQYMTKSYGTSLYHFMNTRNLLP